jgi:hypothetical protein
MRSVLLIAAALLVPAAAWADQSVAGKWKADLGSHVTIEMDVDAHGHWGSETTQNKAVVAKMDGTYHQTKRSATTGNLVFTPTRSQVTQQHGAPTVEHDSYRLTADGHVLRLTSGGDTMVFHKQ